MKSDPVPVPDGESSSRRGRRPMGDRALTPAERQRAYRQRQRRAEISSIGAEANASRVTLLGSLAHALAQLDTDRPAEQQKATRLSASRIIAEIVTRYDIEMPRKPEKPSRARS